MKKCPQCNTVYANETIYCLNDGTLLIEENFSLPSAAVAMNLEDEAETILRHEPMVIDFAQNTSPNEPNPNQTPPNVSDMPPQKSSNIGKYAIFLMLGLLIGGGLVVGAIFLSKGLFQNSNINANRNVATVNTKTVKTPDSNLANRHLAANKIVDEDELNGRVIAVNAYLRAAAGKDSAIVDTLPMDDRLKIGDRENENSPWYQITCEHGTSGWMHGNMIEFTK
jgi:hypothetical protein